MKRKRKKRPIVTAKFVMFVSINHKQTSRPYICICTRSSLIQIRPKRFDKHPSVLDAFCSSPFFTHTNTTPRNNGTISTRIRLASDGWHRTHANKDSRFKNEIYEHFSGINNGLCYDNLQLRVEHPHRVILLTFAKTTKKNSTWNSWYIFWT